MSAYVTIPCNLCGSSDAALLHTGRDRLLKHPGSFRLVRCRGCGLIYQSPRPADIAPYYEGSYLPFEGERSNYRPLLRRHDAENTIFTGSAGLYYGVLKKVVPWNDGRLLDVGCAVGDFLVAMEHFGWEVHGTDVTPAAVAEANQRLSHLSYQPARLTTLEAAAYPDEHFDVVTLWHVIEHLPDPLGSMREVRRILKPGGICLMQTPHWGSLESFLFGPYWGGLDQPRHFWIFSHLTLQALVERAGLRVWQRPSCASYGNLVISSMFWAEANLGEQIGAPLFRLLHQPYLERAANYAMRLIDRSGAGSQLTLAAIKPLRGAGR